tara:strand:+ start:603 stop:2705 length:2103 start_codon:yes stop_codon:yes gene_type:complete
MAQKPIGYYGEFRPTGVDQSAARRFQALAGLADQVGDIAFQIGSKKAEKVGAEKGGKAGREAAEAGTSAETKKGFLASMSIEAQAYNTAMKSAYLSEVSTDAKEQIERIAAEHPDNTTAFLKNAAGYRKGLLEGDDAIVSEDFRDEIAATVDNYIANAQTAVFKNQVAKNRQVAKDADDARLDVLAIEIEERSATGSRIQAEVSLANLYTLLDSQVAINAISLDVAETQKRSARNQLESGLLKAELQADLESDNHVEAYKKLQEFDKPASFTPSEWESFRASAASDISRDQSIYNASQEVAGQNAKKLFDNWATAISLGWEVSPAETAEVERAVAGTELAKQLEVIQQLSMFSLEPTSVRNKILSEADTGVLADADQYAKLIATEQNIQKALAEDALAFGNKQGIVTLDEFDPASPESLTNRLAQAEIASAHYGVPVSPITDNEAQVLSDQITQMTVPEKIKLAKTLQQAPEIWGSIAGKNQAVFAQVGAIGNPDIMQRVLSGHEAIAMGNVTPPTRSEYLPPFENYVGNVYGAEDRAATAQAAIAYYVATQTPGEYFDQSMFVDAVKAVTGGISEVNGYKTQLPRGVDADRFVEFIDAIDPQFIEENGGLGYIDPVTLKRVSYPDSYINKVIKNSQVTNDDNTKYLFTNGSSAFFRMDNGQPFMFSYDATVIARERAREAARRREAWQDTRKGAAGRLM